MPLPRARVAIIGTGFMGRVHCEALRRLGAMDVAAAAGSHIDKARAFADAHGVDRAANDYRVVIADRAVDAIHICTPNASHFEIAASAIAAGKHVVCEKPLAMTSAEAYRSIAGTSVAPEYPQFTDGLRQMGLLDAILASHQRRGWVDVRG